MPSLQELFDVIEAPSTPAGIPSSPEVEGVLTSIRFQQANFLIGKLDNGITIKGEIVGAQVGLEYHFRGRWDRHPKWGDQFVFTEYQTTYPKNLEAIRLYLQENARWIGPEISRALVKAYGADTLQICKSDPGRVASEIKGITSRRAMEISAMLKNNEANEELQLALKELLGGTKVSKRVISKILEKWGQDAPARIRENPYSLIDHFQGVGFLTADEVARKVGYALDGAPRIRAGIVHALKEASFGNGHTCLPQVALLVGVEQLLGVPKIRITQEIKGLIGDGLLILVAGKIEGPPTEDGRPPSVRMVYLPSLFEDEQLVAEKLKILAWQTLPTGTPSLEGLAEDQVEAIGKACSSGVFILTGGPGTGKTYTIKRIIDSFPGAKISLAAPTGKAAKRMFEQSGFKAQTIHKLLEPQKDGDKFVFARGIDNPIEADLIVLDEVSMVDISLMARFLEAVAPGTRLILVGDTYQLPSVGPGNVLKDLIASGQLPCTELTIIKRQDEGLIIRNCHRVKAGEDIELGNSVARDFFFLRRADEESIRETILELVSRRFPEAYQADPLRDVQVISPLREKTGLSCKVLNAEFQRRMNRNSILDGVRFKVGDKVIQTKNQYDRDIINGDIGYVQSIDRPTKSITVQFDSPTRTVPLPLFENDLGLAYCVTCHKYQGSEARIVVIPIHKCFGVLVMQRNWLYTAISRAREVLVLVGQREEIPLIIRRNKQQRRFTRLKEMLQ